jgi:hypothetical protein
MNTSDSPTSTPETAAEPDFVKVRQLSRVLNGQARWRILRELAKGEALPVKLLAAVAGCPPASASKHMAVLKKAGVVQVGYGRLYKLTPRFQPGPGGTRLDLGHCILKLDTKW